MTENVIKGYAPAGSFRSLILLLSLIAIACGILGLFNLHGLTWWWSFGAGLSGLIVFVVAAGSVDRVTIDLDSKIFTRRRGVAGWFHAPQRGTLDDLRCIGLGRRKLSHASSVSWAPVLVWHDEEIHVLDVGDPSDFRQAGRAIRRIADLTGLSIQEDPEEMKCEWHVVPLDLADREPSFLSLMSRKPNAETNGEG